MKTSLKMPEISIIMPTYNQASFISTAILSLLQQTVQDWELIIIDDGSTDNTKNIVKHFLSDSRIKYLKNKENIGLGATLNIGIEKSNYDLICYLPSDDIMLSNHLESLRDKLINIDDTILAFTGVRYKKYDIFGTIDMTDHKEIPNSWKQLIQVMHKKKHLRWIERNELTTDDYNLMYWNRLLHLGLVVYTYKVTCEFIEHQDQRNKKISIKKGGGLNVYRSYYNVNTPLIFQAKGDNIINEVSIYKAYNKKHRYSVDKLKILLVGELSYNPERIYALEQAGHELYGLWAKDVLWFNAVGPFPFGNIKTLKYENYKEEIKKIKPDIIYGLLNTVAAPLCAEVMNSFPDIPFIWHFKEGPFYARAIGYWKYIHQLQTKSDGIIYLNNEIRKYYNICFPQGKRIPYLIMDGDLPIKDIFTNNRSTLLSERQGEIHTVVPGRPFGITVRDIEILSRSEVHFHFYGESWHNLNVDLIKQSQKIAPEHFHLHPNCTPERWVEELSQYDAGWLHCFTSNNNGDYFSTTWEDLNIPARMTTLACAGLPMLQKDNTGHIVATQSICKEHNIGVFFNKFSELGEILSNKKNLSYIRKNVWSQRNRFTFDYYVPYLIDFFREIIKKKRN